MEPWIRLIGPERAVELFGIRLVGVNAETALKLLITFVLIAAVILLRWGLRKAVVLVGGREQEKLRFWTRQGINLALAFVLIIGIASIWFDDPTRLATALGLVTAGLAFALQRVVTAVAGYFVILRGRTFNVGDRIVMGGVRGDVIALDFTQTTIMEMGQPPSVQKADPAMWVGARQYTGRIVTVSNSRIFEDPVYNYSREFPYIWEEITIPLAYSADRHRAEEILMDVARRHTLSYEQLGAEALREMQRRYFLKPNEVGPKIYWRLTDNWLELTVRFVAGEHGVRSVKDRMSRDILADFEAAGISLASATFEITGVPAIRLDPGDGRSPSDRSGDEERRATMRE